MKCEEARALFPEHSGGDLEESGDLEVHLATCTTCSAELARYREVLGGVRLLANDLEETPAGFTERVMLKVGEPRVPTVAALRRLAEDRRVKYTLASLVGAVVGAVAVGLLWRRSGRRLIAGDA